MLAKNLIFKTEDDVPVEKVQEKNMNFFFIKSLKSLKKVVGSISQRYPTPGIRIRIRIRIKMSRIPYTGYIT
jgi:hypothetical protein